MISDEEGIAAVRAARAVSEAETEDRDAEVSLPESFGKMRSGVFVTILEYPSKELRGCIGYPLPPHDLAHTLVMAAKGVCSDPRFLPLRLSEAKNCTFDVTILTEPERIVYKDPEDLKSQIEIGKDGIIARYAPARRSGLFLPQVPVEQGWDIDEYLDGICMKAGLPADAWKSGALEFEKFQGECFGETEPYGEIVRKMIE